MKYLARIAVPLASDNRKKANGYTARKTYTNVAGFSGRKIWIENPAGSTRRGKNSDGTPWATQMLYDYGRIAGTKGTDGECLDCYIHPSAVNADESRPVYVIHQKDPQTGRYDEDKLMIGFPSRNSAVSAYLKHYNDDGYYGFTSKWPDCGHLLDAMDNRQGSMLFRSSLLPLQNEDRQKYVIKAKYIRREGEK